MTGVQTCALPIWQKSHARVTRRLTGSIDVEADIQAIGRQRDARRGKGVQWFGARGIPLQVGLPPRTRGSAQLRSKPRNGNAKRPKAYAEHTTSWAALVLCYWLSSQALRAASRCQSFYVDEGRAELRESSGEKGKRSRCREEIEGNSRIWTPKPRSKAYYGSRRRSTGSSQSARRLASNLERGKNATMT